MIPFFIETYGCQMNVYDSEVVASLLEKAGYAPCDGIEDAAVILVNTCSIRENAEQRVWGRLEYFRQLKKRRPSLQVAVLGCMASRLKEKLLENTCVDFVVGPDSYRLLPQLLGQECPAPVQTQLSRKETYADILPLRMDKHGVTTFVSIMRGCNNMCAYCIVPYVRGGERSRDPFSIEQEVRDLFAKGYKEVNLLGQNVDSYGWESEDGKVKETFSQLLERVARISPLLRVRFATSHPKDMNDSVLHTMAAYSNICHHIHLPVQSGSDAQLAKMKRTYNRATYLERIAKIREILPDCVISTDMISGFCDESEEDHLQTLSLMREVRFDQAFMFQYSERPNTYAARHYTDNVPEAEKTRRLNEVIALQTELSAQSNRADIGKVFEVLVEGPSKRSDLEYFGRTSTNKVCVFPRKGVEPGMYVKVKVCQCSAATLLGEIVE